VKDTIVNRSTAQVPGAQDQFLTVLSREEAASRFQSHLAMEPLGEETVALASSLGVRPCPSDSR
jgi:hypothetical protein